jgi:hypothetical protein
MPFSSAIAGIVLQSYLVVILPKAVRALDSQDTLAATAEG